MNGKKYKVITLIVLVIVFIILVGVGINLVLGDNVIITKDTDLSKKQETEENAKKIEITAINIESDESYIGKYVNYGGQETYKGVKWRIFNAENGQIQLIADDYIKSDVMPTATNILKGTEYGSMSGRDVSAEEDRITLLNYINTTSNWSDFVAVTGATVTGGPTIEQFKNSYNRTHEAKRAYIKEIYIAQSEVMKDGLKGYHVGTSENPETNSIDGLYTSEMENLYVIDNSNMYAYWLGSPSASYTSCVMSIAYWGAVDYTLCYGYNMGLRPLVILPTGVILVEQENGTFNIQLDLNEMIQNEEANNEVVNNKNINKIYEEKDIVYSSYSKYSSEYSYSIPYINIKSLDVEKINQEIENHYKPLIEKELENEKEGFSVIMGNIKYNSYLNNNILSLVISELWPNDCIYYKAYNVDIYTGKNISNSEIINQKNITENEFINKLNILYKAKFTNNNGSYADLTETESKEFYEEQLNKTISKDNYSIKTPIFLGENGNINVIAEIYSLAGADSYYNIIDMGV